MKIILVVAAHPDDEVLGCGGTIARHLAEGDEVHIVFMADGVTSRGICTDSAEHNERNHAAFEASQILGITTPLTFLGFPDNRMDTIALLDITQSLEKVIRTIQPEIIYTHHFGDLNIDHQITHKAVMTACRPQGNYSVKTILCFEIPSSTEWQTPNSGQAFEPNWFVDVSEVFKLKIRALKAYEEEMRDSPHPRSIESVEYKDRLTGGRIGVFAAEPLFLAMFINNTIKLGTEKCV